LLAPSRPDSETIYVRAGEEFSGIWMPWAAVGHAPGKFRFEWNVNVGGTQMNAAYAYLGDEYVDVIEMDFWYNVAWRSRKSPTLRGGRWSTDPMA
jgi:hypothetical protein